LKKLHIPFVALLLLFATLTNCLGQSDELLNGIRELMAKYMEGDFSKALEISKKDLALTEKEFGKQDPLYGIVLSVHALSEAGMGLAADADRDYRTALSLLVNAPGPEYESFVGRIYAGMAQAEMLKGNFEIAEQLFTKAIDVYKRTVGVEGADYANVINDLGNLYKETGKYSESEKFLTDAATLRKNVFGEYHTSYGLSLNNLASLYEQMGDYRRAADMYSQSYEIFHSALGEYHPLIATSLNNYAGLYWKVGEYENAYKFYLHALAICERVFGKEHDRYVSTLSNLANVCRLMRNFDKAEEFNTQCLEIRKRTQGTSHIDYAYSLNNLALAKMDKKQYAEAESYFLQAMQIFKQRLGVNHKNVAVCANNLGVLYFKQKNPEQASRYLKQSLDISLKSIDNVFPAISDKEKMLFYRTMKDDFEFFNFFASQSSTVPGIVADVYNNTIATKALLLNASNKVRKRILSSNDAPLIQLYNEWREKKNRMAQVWQMTAEEKMKNHIDEAALDAEVNALEKKLSASSELFASNYNKTRYTWKDIQRKLKPGEAAVEIIRFRNFNFEFTDTARYAAIIVKSTSSLPEMVLFENGNFMEQKAISFYKKSIKYNSEDTKSYNYFWAPIASKLTGITKVFFSPDGVYNQLSINSLYNADTKKFVMDEVEVQQVTNTKDILSLPRSAAVRNAVMVGFPDYKTLPNDGSSAVDDAIPQMSDSVRSEMGNLISSLPGTLSEVNKIGAIFKSKNIPLESAIGVSASEAFLKKIKSPSVLHIATHGFFLADVEKNTDGTRGGFMGQDPVKVQEHPLLRSGILLAGAQKTVDGVHSHGEDGILSAYEAMNLNLDNTQIVVLSACETGLGEVQNGEGVYGFQRALIIAGAQTVVMSLWKVNDQVTQELMVLFYQYWMNGMSKRAAFLEAQKKVREQHPEPSLWAPFIFIGDN
jgi:CHAT domain-containing protein/tetratricopeptide (TPR) repeat protein